MISNTILNFIRLSYLLDMKILYLLLVCLLLQVQTKIVYLAQLFRHGARYPVSDIYDGKDTKPFHGQLTSIGMRQQYLLGSYIKRDYVDTAKLFNGTINPREVQVFTDGSERCYQSAYAHAAGLFQINSGELLPSGISNQLLNPPFQSLASLQSSDQQILEAEFALTKGYQPVPIKASQTYFGECPNQALVIAKRLQAIAVKSAQFQAEQAAFSVKIASMFGLSPALGNIGGMIELYDVVVCDLNLGRPMPAKFTQKDFLELKFIQNYMFVLLYAEHLARVESTPFAENIILNMQKVIAGKLDSKKLTIISGHDTNVAPMLTFLNLTTAECVHRKFKNQSVVGNCAQPVPFASSIQYQLHIRDNAQQNSNAPSDYFVKIRYNGDYYLLCQSKSQECSFPEFSARIKHQLVDHKKQCGSK